jgi:hypothetical protein
MKNTRNTINIVLYTLYSHYKNDKEDNERHFSTAKIIFLLLCSFHLIPIIFISSLFLGHGLVDNVFFMNKIALLILATPFYFLLSHLAMSYQEMLATDFSDKDRKRGEIWLTAFVISTIFTFLFGTLVYHILKP